MFRKPLFWAAFVAVSLGAVFFALQYFSSAFPITTLDLRMNRQEALSMAREISTRLQLPPEGYSEVASFSGDQMVQNFVELEGGGTAALRSMIAGGLYHPYTWKVRHFKPGETRETAVRFTPDGAPYGFAVKLPEDEPGAALEADQAQLIAERAAAADWQVNLNNYQLAEKSREVRTKGRVDHTFTYERSDARVGEGRYRLRLVVSGDKLTELTRFVRVPEAFSRRYEQMRSANDLISMIDSTTLVLLYFIGGCGVGLFFLLRKRWVQWRTPLLWGGGIALLQLLAGINDWPLSWMGYDTAISADSFTAQRIAQLLFLFLLYVVVFTLSFMAAESLSRRAFPHHIQHWKLWSAGIANSKAVLGRTAGGYLLVGLFFGYDVFLYYVASRALGWWSPSDTLVQPDILSAYLPWFSPIAVAAQAGFWEESLFRAVPIACAALLGDRYGKRKWWIAGAMILQALIFGAGHAGYMNQPAYARLVELIIPSLAFGALYLCFGLLPGIVLHFSFDVVWLSLPLFVSTAPGIWVDRFFVIAAVLVPLWVVLGARFRAKAWSEVPESQLNRAWCPPEVQQRAAAEEPVAPAYRGAGAWGHALPLAGLIGLLLWIFAGHFKSDAPPLNVARGPAEALAQRAIEDRGVHLGQPPWQALTAVEAQPGPADRFVWQKAGKGTYESLMGQYLAPPHWKIRFVRFEGDVAERAEEYQVFAADAHGVYRFRHILAEDAARNSLSESDARTLAQGALSRQFQIEPPWVKEVSAVSSKLKARTDWVFTFSDERGQSVAPGEKRIAVQIAGDQVADAYRYIYTPEEWDRQDRDRQVVPSIINVSCIVIVVLVVLAGAVAAIVAWSRKRFAVSIFLFVLAALLAIRIIDLANSLPSFLAQFSTAQPYKFQLVTIIAAGLLAFVVMAGSTGLLAGFVGTFGKFGGRHQITGGNVPGTDPTPTPDLVPVTKFLTPGIALGCLAAGLAALASSPRHALAPYWPDFAPLGAYFPLLQGALGPLGRYLVQVTIMLLVFAAVDRFTRSWTRRKPLFALLLFLFGFTVAGSMPLESVAGWLAAGAVTGALLLISYLVVARFSLHVMVFAVGTFEILGTLKEGLAAAYPHALPGAISGSLLIAAAAVLLRRMFARRSMAAAN